MLRALMNPIHASIGLLQLANLRQDGPVRELDPGPFSTPARARPARARPATPARAPTMFPPKSCSRSIFEWPELRSLTVFPSGAACGLRLQQSSCLLPFFHLLGWLRCFAELQTSDFVHQGRSIRAASPLLVPARPCPGPTILGRAAAAAGRFPAVQSAARPRLRAKARSTDEFHPIRRSIALLFSWDDGPRPTANRPTRASAPDVDCNRDHCNTALHRNAC